MTKAYPKITLPKVIHLLKAALFLMVLGTIALIVSYSVPISENCQYLNECTKLDKLTGFSTLVYAIGLPAGMLLSLITLTWKAIKSEGK